LSDEAPTNSTYDRFFDGWRIARTEIAKALVTEVITDAQAYEQAYQPRKRKRQAAAQRTFETVIQAVIIDLAHAYLMADERPCAIPRSKRVLDARDQYKSPALTGTLPDVLDLLQASGWLCQEMGERKAFQHDKRTTIKPTPRLCEAVQKHSLTLFDLSRAKGEEVVIMKAVKDDYWAKGGRVQYDDDEETHRIRTQVRTINEWIAQANIEFDEEALERNISLDSSDITLRRYFSRNSFQSGGRMFGGFWQQLKEAERLNGIFINSEDVAEIDYGQIAARILYGLAGVPVPKGDLYEIPGLTRINGQSYRNGIKLLFNSLTFMEHEPTRKPKNSKGKLPSHLKIEQIVDLIKQAHPAIARYFGTPTGHYVQFRESEVMVNVLLRLRDDNIVALPVHDAVVVRCSAKARTMDIMRSVFEELIGVEVTLSCDTRSSYTTTYNTNGLVDGGLYQGSCLPV
jgi:hypothetical protein